MPRRSVCAAVAVVIAVVLPPTSTRRRPSRRHRQRVDSDADGTFLGSSVLDASAEREPEPEPAERRADPEARDEGRGGSEDELADQAHGECDG